MVNNVIAIISQNYGLFKVKHSKSKNPFKFGTPEKKLLIIFSYYTLFHVTIYIYYMFVIKNLKDGSTEFQKYITCESSGHDPEDPCDKSSKTGGTSSTSTGSINYYFPLSNTSS